MADAMTGGIDPGYGGYATTNKLLATATNTPEAANGWLQNAAGQVVLQQHEYDLGTARANAFKNVAASLLQNPSADNVQAVLTENVKNGTVPADMAQRALQTTAGMNDQQRRQWALDNWMQIADHQQQMDTAFGKPTMVDTGNALAPYIVKQGPQGGYYPTSGGTGPIPVQQRPDSLGDMVEVPNPDGSKTMMTKAQAQQRSGYNPNGSGPYGDIAGGRASVKNGRIVYNGQSAAAGIPAAPTQPAGGGMSASAQPAASAGIPGPLPGTAQAAEATAAASAAMGNQLTKAADDATTRRATLSNLQDQASKIVTGPGAERVNTAKAGANAVADMVLGPDAGPRFDRATIAAGEEFHKNAEILAQQQQGALGGTDAALASGKASNPNLGLSTTGNKEILAMLQGNEDAIQAKNAAWQQWQKANGAGSYPAFAAEFNKTFSPRAFQFAHMSVEARNAAVKSMEPAGSKGPRNRPRLCGEARMDQAAVDDAPGLNPGDRDALIRTVLTEGAQNDPQAWASVAAVVRNRLAAGGYGSSVSQIVKAPGQFEVWSNGRAQGVDPRSDAYQQAGRIVDAIAGGLPDPTNGATHFFSPAGQAQLGRNAPSWGGKNVTAVMGGHVYSAPNGRVDLGITPDPQPAAPPPAAATTPQPQAKAAAPMANTDPLKRWGVSLDEDGAAGASRQAAPAQPAQVAAKGDTLSRWGVSLDDTPPAATAQSPQATPAGVAPPTGTPAASPVAAGDDAAAVGRGLINGVPVAGPYLLGGLNRVAAAARAVTKGEPYTQALQEVQQFGDKTAEAYPLTTGASQMIGGGLAMAPIAAAAPVAFGIRGATLAGRMMMGSASNAALGAADATARGDNPLAGAAFGYAGGGLGPLAGRIGSSVAGGALSKLGEGYNALSQYLGTGSGSGVPGLGRAAAGMVSNLIQADGPQAVTNRLMQYGPDAMLADAGPSLTTIAGGLARRPAAEGAVIMDALKARAAGANDRIGTQVAETVGPNPGSNFALDQAYEGIRSGFDNAAYPAVHANAPPVDAGRVLTTISQQLAHATGPQRAVLQRFQQELTRAAHVEPAVTDPVSGATITPETTTWDSQTLHNIRQDMDSVIRYGDPQVGVQPGTLSRTQGAIGTMRSSLDDALKTQVPGMADADARSALNAANQNSVQDGYGSVMGKNVPDPTDFAAARAGANPATNAASNLGMASRIYREFGTGTQRDAVTLNKLLAGGDDGFSAGNLRTAFGDEPTNRLLAAAERERAFDDTTQTVTRNSVTGRVAEANKLLDATQPGSLDLKNATPTGLALQAGKAAVVDPIVKMIMESPDAPRNLEVARALAAQGATRDQIVEGLKQFAQRRSIVSGASGALSNTVNAGLNRLLLAAGATQRTSF